MRDECKDTTIYVRCPECFGENHSEDDYVCPRCGRSWIIPMTWEQFAKELLTVIEAMTPMFEVGSRETAAFNALMKYSPLTSSETWKAHKLVNWAVNGKVYNADYLMARKQESESK